MSAPATIELNRVSKWFGSVVAVNDVSFRGSPGISALLGPNGAGKTTLLHMMGGFISVSSGEIRLDGAAVDGGVDSALRFSQSATALGHRVAVLAYGRPDAAEWIATFTNVVYRIADDGECIFTVRRHDIAEFKKPNNDTIDRIKDEAPAMAEHLAKDYRRLIRMLSAKAKEAGE